MREIEPRMSAAELLDRALAKMEQGAAIVLFDEPEEGDEKSEHGSEVELGGSKLEMDLGGDDTEPSPPGEDDGG